MGTARPWLPGGFASVWSRKAGSEPEASGESGVDPTTPRILAAFNMRNGEEAGQGLRLAPITERGQQPSIWTRSCGSRVCGSAHRPRPLASAGLHLMSDLGLKWEPATGPRSILNLRKMKIAKIYLGSLHEEI